MTTLPPHAPPPGALLRPAPSLAIAGALLSIALLWDASGLDVPMARAFGDLHGFAWRHHWLLSTVLHQGGRLLSWLLALALCLGVWMPWGVLRRLDKSRRLQLAVTTLAAAAVVAALKSGNATSCPWDLQAFGGVARHLDHWQGWGEADGGAGHCFPAGHASAGFAFLGGAFVFRPWPAVARRWLAAALAAGLLLGLGQQARGAHFMSHTLWTGWLCWMVAWALHLAWPATGQGVAA